MVKLKFKRYGGIIRLPHSCTNYELERFLLNQRYLPTEHRVLLGKEVLKVLISAEPCSAVILGGLKSVNGLTVGTHQIYSILMIGFSFTSPAAERSKVHPN